MKLYINSLVDRKSGLVLITKLYARTAKETSGAIQRRLKHLPKQTIIFDNGSENQKWDELEKELEIDRYFAHPYSSW